MPIPFQQGDKVTLVMRYVGSETLANGSRDTSVQYNDDQFCFIKDSDVMFCRLTGAEVPKVKGRYVAIHTTGYSEEKKNRIDMITRGAVERIKDIEQSGWDAYFGGAEIEDNPYPKKTHYHSAWMAGWLRAENEDT